MDGSECDALRAETMRLQGDALQMVELLADLACRRHLWQSLVTQLIREKAALQLANERLRDELRRYTRRQVE